MDDGDDYYTCNKYKHVMETLMIFLSMKTRCVHQHHHKLAL